MSQFQIITQTWEQQQQKRKMEMGKFVEKLKLGPKRSCRQEYAEFGLHEPSRSFIEVAAKMHNFNQAGEHVKGCIPDMCTALF